MPEFIETYLRTGGIVPWCDIRDLEAGTVERNITQAFEEGLSGGVLLLSDGISKRWRSAWQMAIVAGNPNPQFTK